ncbi:DUF4255 domain-containing protein [Roseateles cavernae]|uniref:DUF4255 domain-containing protein n=1 Tax=Roseateles cavernae TaxID=3153578 RepID=UPI0032E4AE11
MAGVTAIHALCSGLAQHLSRAYQLRPIAGLSCKFEPAGVSELKKLDDQDSMLTLMVWRIGHNEQLRNRPALQLPQGRVAALSLNVHLLLSVWADTAMKEQSLLGWVLRELLQRPVLDASVLGEGFGPDEQVPLLAEDLSLDELSKLWQVLLPPLRPSLGFVARNVMLELDPEPDHGPVLARRIALGAEVRS